MLYLKHARYFSRVRLSLTLCPVDNNTRDFSNAWHRSGLFTGPESPSLVLGGGRELVREPYKRRVCGSCAQAAPAAMHYYDANRAHLLRINLEYSAFMCVPAWVLFCNSSEGGFIQGELLLHALVKTFRPRVNLSFSISCFGWSPMAIASAGE